MNPIKLREHGEAERGNRTPFIDRKNDARKCTHKFARNCRTQEKLNSQLFSLWHWNSVDKSEQRQKKSQQIWLVSVASQRTHSTRCVVLECCLCAHKNIIIGIEITKIHTHSARTHAPASLNNWINVNCSYDRRCSRARYMGASRENKCAQTSRQHTLAGTATKKSSK